MYLECVELEKVYRESVKRHSDTGSCVMGYNLKVNGKKVVPQPYQGSSGCYNVYQDVSEYMKTELGVHESDITIDMGRMD